MLVALEKLPIEDKKSLLQQLWQSLFADYQAGKISHENISQIKRELVEIEPPQPAQPVKKRQFGLYQGKGSFELMEDFEMTEEKLITL